MIRLSRNVRTVITADGGVVLDVQRGQMFRTNPIGSKILEFLQQGFGEPRIVEELSRLCNVPEDAIAPDVREFLTSIEQQHLLETDGRASTESGTRR